MRGMSLFPHLLVPCTWALPPMKPTLPLSESCPLSVTPIPVPSCVSHLLSHCARGIAKEEGLEAGDEVTLNFFSSAQKMIFQCLPVAHSMEVQTFTTDRGPPTLAMSIASSK